jgi:hypothetical protein
MAQYRKKPVVIEAVQFTGYNRREVLQFIYPSMSEDGLRGAEVAALPVVIGTLEGDMTADPGDWVIRGVKGEFYPCKPDIFAATYEPASDAPSDEDRIRDAMAEAQDHPGRVVTR